MKRKYYNATEFARLMGVNYRTVLNWANAGIIPKAKWRHDPRGGYWEIPESALTMEKPRKGRGNKIKPGKDGKKL